jgi:hypothetical protein
MRPASPEEIERFKTETGIANLDEDPPGTVVLTLGQFLDEALERRRLARGRPDGE